MRKKWLMLLSIASCGLSWGMSYNPNCCDLYGCRPNCGLQGGQIDVWADALLLQPSSCDFDFAVADVHSPCKHSQTNFPCGDECGKKPNYHWGFRVGVDYHPGCEELDGSIYYSHLDGSDNSSRTAFGKDHLWPSTRVSGFTPNTLFSEKRRARACLDVRQKWNAVDSEVGYSLKQACNYSIRGHIGLHWTNINVNKCVAYRGHFTQDKKHHDNWYSGQFCSDIKTWGIGPRFGADFQYNLCYGIGLAARASWGILAGETRQNIEGKNFEHVRPGVEAHRGSKGNVKGLPNGFGSLFCINNKRRTVVFPEFDTSLGVNYNLCLCNRFNCLFEIGWEFRTYLQSLVHSYHIDQAQTASVCDPFNLQGLYVRGMIKF